MGVVFDFAMVFEGTSLQIQMLDDRARELLRLPPDEAAESLTWPMLMRGETLPTLLYEILPRLAEGKLWRGDLLLRRRDGAELPVQAFAAPTFAEGALQSVTLGGIDRTDTARLMDALRHEQGLLRALLNTVPESVYFKDLQSRFIRVSAAKAKKARVDRAEDLIGRTDFDHFASDHAQTAFRDEQEIIRTGKGIIDYEEKETWPDGSVTWVSSTKLPLRDGMGRIIGTFGISRDITAHKLAESERREMEGQLHLAQKMESIGRLAAGIAHEVNTPTQFINDNTHFLVGAIRQISDVVAAYRRLRDAASAHGVCSAAVEEMRQVEEQSEIDYLLDEIPVTLDQTLQGIGRIAKIVRSLKEFSHPGAPEKRPANLNHAIDTIVNVTRHEWKYVAEVVTDLDPDLPSVPCMLDELNQVVLNLIVNAAHAIGDVVKDSGNKGTITLRTRRDGNWARIEVEDTGTGIPVEVQSRVFEPFFTTKDMGKGTGQGLAMVQTIIVKKHQGQVSFSTETGKGTTFVVLLPIDQPEGVPAP